MILDVYEPSDPEVVKAMLDLADLKSGEIYFDLGSGDGRFVVEGNKRGAISTGIEIDKGRALKSRKDYGINVVNQDCLETDISKADVITCWFSVLPETIDLIEKLKKEMKIGARLVKQNFTPSSWEPVSNTLATSYTKEVFQSKNGIRINGQLIFLYIK